MAKKRSGTDRRMVSLPAKLNRRLSKVKDVNWSAVACEAFEGKLGEIAAQKKEKDMQDVIDRLRASKNEGENEAYDEGKAFGVEWARDSAEYHELERLVRLRQEWGQDWGRLFTGEMSGPRCVPDLIIADAIVGTEEREAHEEFWEIAVGENWRHAIGDSSFLDGFADGALEVWQKVASQV